MNPSRSLVAVSVLCLFASASLTPAFAQTTRGGATHDDSSGNAFQLLPGILKAIQAQKKREAERKAAAERAREEQQQQDEQSDNASTDEQPVAAPPVIERPIPRPHILRPKPKPHRTPPVTKPLLTPTPLPRAAIAPPVVAAPPTIHFKPVPATPQIAAPLSVPGRDGLLILLAAIGVAVAGALGYHFRGAFGFLPPPPTARAAADIGTASAPVFEHEGPQVSFMIGLPAGVTTSDYPEPAQ